MTESGATGATSDAVRLRDDGAAWDEFVATAELGHFIQLSAWADILAPRGWEPLRIVTSSADGRIGAQVMLRRMRLLPWAYGYAWRGPVADSYSAVAIDAFTAAVRAEATRRRLTHVYVDPELPAGGPEAGRFLRAGWRRARGIQPSKTRVVDLGATEKELWSGLSSSCRNRVNKSRRLGVTVSVVGEEGLADFERLHDATVARAGIRRRDVVAAYRAFAARDAAVLLLERDAEGNAIAAILDVVCGRRVYELYNGSIREGPAASVVNYQIHWQAMMGARERGFASYDFFGTDLPNLATFKQQFGGEEREFAGGFELVTSWAGRLALAVLRRARGFTTRQPVNESSAETHANFLPKSEAMRSSRA
ncbi:MAG: aminoacyltransferase [Chloroflexi bacterium]|nr:MAG: aminoacyltransferase [Chloroflexota bacterium]